MDEAWRAACNSFALSVLQQHAAQLDAAEVMRVLPGHLGVASLLPVLGAMLAESTHTRHEAQMLHGLARAHLTQTQHSLQLMRERRVVITKTRTCPASHQPIRDRVFVVYPNNTVVLSAAATANCPVTGRDFKSLPLEAAYEDIPTD